MITLHKIRVELSKNRLAKWLNSNPVHEIFHPRGWEPDVLGCLCYRNWNGPVWDVGASLGRHAYRVAKRHKVYAFEPNLNSLQFLGENLRGTDAVIVPCALTIDGRIINGSVHPDFREPNTGPKVATLSISEAITKFGKPGVIKLDIEGGEYQMLLCPNLIGITLLVEWHGVIPKALPHWYMETIDNTHSLLTPCTI